jgi:hypothetical protein
MSCRTISHRYLYVGLETDPGKYRVLTTVADIAQTLIGAWPQGAEGDVWRAALSACLRALEAQVNGDAAREAFILAARDANIELILDPTMLEPPESNREGEEEAHLETEGALRMLARQHHQSLERGSPYVT